MKYLLGQSEIFQHFITGGEPVSPKKKGKGKGKGKSGAASPARRKRRASVGDEEGVYHVASGLMTLSCVLWMVWQLLVVVRSVCVDGVLMGGDNLSPPQRLPLAVCGADEEGVQIVRLTRQPDEIKNGTMRDYQLEGLNWMLSLFENGELSGSILRQHALLPCGGVACCAWG